MRIHVISLDRPSSVPNMEAKAGGAELVWCVPANQALAYHSHGASQVLVGPRGKAAKINAILDANPDEWVITTDDDCQKLVRLREGKPRTEPISLEEAAVEYVEAGKRYRREFLAIPDFTNTLYMGWKMSSWGRTIGWFAAHAPGFRPRYDVTLNGGEDTDIACKAFLEYGRIGRPNWIMGVYRCGGPDSHFLEMHTEWESMRILAARYPMLIQWEGVGAKVKYKVVGG